MSSHPSRFIHRTATPFMRRLLGVVIAVMVSLTTASTYAASFKVRLVENDIPPGLANGVQFLDHLTLTNNGRFIFGGDTFAGSSDDFFYTGTLKPFSLSLAMEEGTQIPGEPGVVYVRGDSVVDINEAGDHVFVAETDPGVLDSVFKNGLSVIREGDILFGDTINSLHHPQIDGDGNVWFLADIGADSSTDITLVRNSTMIIRDGGVIDGVPINSISTSEAGLGSNFRVNQNGDYMILIDDGDAQGQDAHVILNGVNVIESGDFLPGVIQPVYWFTQNGLTETGNHWWVKLEVESITSPGFAGDDMLVMDGNTVLIAQGDDLGGGLIVGAVQLGAVNSNGDWVARVELDGAGGGDRALIINGGIAVREGDPIDEDFSWGSNIALVQDMALNDCGEIALIADVIPTGTSTPLESVVTGSIYDAADIDGDFDIGADDTVAFVAALLGAPATECDARRADLNDDGAADGLDIAPFVDALLP